MSSCFLFIDKMNDEDTCLSLGLNSQGEVDAPLLQRSFQDIKTLQTNAKTYIVMTAKLLSFHQIELPWLGDKKARAAIPYALEEKLAQGVEGLHFAFDAQHYQNGSYLISVMDKDLINELLAKLEAHQIQFHLLTADWFALKANEACIMPNGMLVNDTRFQGFLDEDLAPIYLNNLEENEKVYSFNDSNPTLMTKIAKTEEMQEDSYLWIAKALLNSKPMNFCQGEIKQNTGKMTTKHWYITAGIFTLVWLLSIVIFNSIEIYHFNQQIKEVDDKIASIYFKFFPEAKQVISPKFRINQLLKSTRTNSDVNFWVLLNKLTPVFKNSKIQLQQLRYQNQLIIINLKTPDFTTLETMQNTLRISHVKVKQTQASTVDGEVLGTLELHL